MSLELKIPEGLWDDGQEGVLGTWFYQSGEAVPAGAVVAEVFTEKVAHELEAPCAGTLTILVEEEEPVSAGQVVAILQ